MKKKEIIQKLIKYFQELIKEKEIEKQQKIANKIDDFCAKINDEVEAKYWNEPIEDIQKVCLVLHHLKDETNYCELRKRDIKNIIKKLKNEITI